MKENKTSKNAGGNTSPCKVGATTDIAETKSNSKVKAENDPIFKAYGPPFLTGSGGSVTLNERAVAAGCATKYQVKYDPTQKAYARYDAGQGLWSVIHEVEVRRLLGDFVLELGRVHGMKGLARVSSWETT